MGRIQRRTGPRVVGFLGILQPFADGRKLLVKQPILPSARNTPLYLRRPIISFRIRLLRWLAIPLSSQSLVFDTPFSILYLFRISRLEVYGVLFAGWRSQSQYAILGCLRSTAQIISYEVCMGLVFICVLLPRGTLQFAGIVRRQQESWLLFATFPVRILFGICVLAETNRAPFDLPEREAELVAGYNVEYSSIGFALFFLREYRIILRFSRIFRILFCGGWSSPWWFPGGLSIGIKTRRVFFGFVWVRRRFPRYRYDQLIQIGWQTLLPLAIRMFGREVVVLRLFLRLNFFELEEELEFLR